MLLFRRYRNKSYRHWITVVSLVCFLFSGSTTAFSMNELPVGLPAPDTNSTTGTFRSLSVFEDKLLSARTVETTPDNGDNADGEVPHLSVYFKDFFSDITGGTKNIYSRNNIPMVLFGTGLTALSLTVDDEFGDYARDRRPMDNISGYGRKLGQVSLHAGIGAALFGTGKLTNDKKLADTGIVTIESLLVNMAATQGLKYAVRRKRPDGSDRLSFPSGHASSTAALAASISEMYDWDPRIAIPLYVTTAFVGASRIQDNQHYLSDVFAGITLGTVIGTSMARHHKEKETAKKGLKSLSIKPVFEKDLKGLIFTFKW